MICFSKNRPALKVGPQTVVGYPTDWIEQALARAAKAGGRADCPFLSDLSEAVIHYLENRCPLALFPIEDLYRRMRLMLRRAGCPDLAAHLTLLAPPVTVSLIGPARRATRAGAPTFFKILDEEIRLLSQAGAEVIHFRDIDESVDLLRQPFRPRWDAEHLKREIRDFLEGHHREISFPHRDLHLTLEP
jgi:hypothetical protein